MKDLSVLDFPERGSERGSIGTVSAIIKSLQMVAGNQLVLNGGAVKMGIVTPMAHHFGIVIHSIGGIRDADNFTASKKRVDQLVFRGHHPHSSHFICEFRNGNQITLFNKIHRFAMQSHDKFRFFARFHILLFHVLQRRPGSGKVWQLTQQFLDIISPSLISDSEISVKSN